MIDLSAYTASMKRFLKEREMACVYVLARAGGRPSRIGYAMDIWNHVSMIQSVSAETIEVAELLWTPGKMVAIAIDSAVRADLERFHLRQRWFDIDSSVAASHASMTAEINYPGANIVSHQAFVSGTVVIRATGERA